MTYIQNRLPTSSCDRTPYEKETGRKPDLSNIKIFCCRAYAYIQKPHRRKLDATTEKGYFWRIHNSSKVYRICPDGRKIIESRTVKFLENKNQDIIQNNASKEIKEVLNGNNLQPKMQLIHREMSSTDKICKIRMGTRIHQAPHRIYHVDTTDQTEGYPLTNLPF